MNRHHATGIVTAFAWMVLGFLALPAFAVVPISFTDTRYLSMPDEHFSLQHWRAFLSSSEWHNSIWQSLWIATVSTLAAEAGYQGSLRLDLERGCVVGRLLDGSQGRPGRKGHLGLHRAGRNASVPR